MRKTYTGKVHGKQDDLVIALQLACIGNQKFWQDSRYARFRSADTQNMQVSGLRPDRAPDALYDRPVEDRGGWIGPTRGEFN